MESKHSKMLIVAGLVLAGAVGATVAGFPPGFLLILLICPLMMMFMMMGMAEATRRKGDGPSQGETEETAPDEHDIGRVG
ncbi:DUF2933 domain-containing protein [Aquihabitans sp. G128]|uniref:DUF2933 domain-containing protein n=1 Tax=Aquihabitans sp. G128 TaxID=2849779 RepID=UPI001C24EFAC|nr:DUF2933 domain-containing protein [Aquihabitans sp. G128]QXC60587.1 DUF2933 domain-containing protein [Aquihabitans sp. G128]